MKRQIPNLITCMNVISGTLAVLLAMYGELMWAASMILMGMIFDFFDGMTARLLHVKSDMGKELDSLADMVTFGVAPAILAYHLILKEMPGSDLAHFFEWNFWEKVAIVAPLAITPFSAYRLAKFNLDARQIASFIGMPTPANALFWVGLIFGSYYMPHIYSVLFADYRVLAICALALSILLVCELPMFSLKISGFGWRGNEIRYVYAVTLMVLFCIFGEAICMFIIPLYILFSIAGTLIRLTTSNR